MQLPERGSRICRKGIKLRRLNSASPKKPPTYSILGAMTSSLKIQLRSWRSRTRYTKTYIVLCKIINYLVHLFKLKILVKYIVILNNLCIPSLKFYISAKGRGVGNNFFRAIPQRDNHLYLSLVQKIINEQGILNIA